MSESFKIRFAVCALLLPMLAGCFNPYACQAEHRFAEYKGRLGLDAPLEGELTARDSGRIFLSLDQSKGRGAHEQVTVSVNVWSFAQTVETVHVHERSGSNAGRLLISVSSGLLVRDSIWNGYPQQHAGPVSWQDVWETLEEGNAYLEVHPSGGAPAVRGLLTLARSRGYQPSCT